MTLKETNLYIDNVMSERIEMINRQRAVTLVTINAIANCYGVTTFDKSTDGKIIGGNGVWTFAFTTDFEKVVIEVAATETCELIGHVVCNLSSMTTTHMFASSFPINDQLTVAEIFDSIDDAINSLIQPQPDVDCEQTTETTNENTMDDEDDDTEIGITLVPDSE